MSTTYRRIRHAARYGRPGTGHDLEQWDVEGGVMRDGVPPRPGIPITAEYHHGYVREGMQHWVFTRRAPFGEGTCERCEFMVQEHLDADRDD